MIEGESKNNFEYQEIQRSIKEKGYFSIPANTPVKVKVVTGNAINIPIKDLSGNETENTAQRYYTQEKELKDVILSEDIMVGDVRFYSPVEKEVGLSLTSQSLVDARKKLEEWRSEFTKENEIPDRYINQEHEEQFTGEVDTSLYAKDFLGSGEVMQEKEKELAKEISMIQDKVNADFLNNVGESIPEGKSLLEVSLYIEA